MGQAITAISTVVALVVGAVGTYLVGKLADRDRFAREMQVRWDQRRLDAYVTYVLAVKSAGTLANQIHEARINQTPGADRATEDLANTEVRRAEAFEALPLLADGDTIEAAHELNHATWHLARSALRETNLSEAEWHALADKWIEALNNFHAAARAGLSVPGQFSRRDTAALAVSRPERARIAGIESRVIPTAADSPVQQPSTATVPTEPHPTLPNPAI